MSTIIAQQPPLSSTTTFEDDDDLHYFDQEPSIDLKRIESCYSKEKQTLSWRCDNNNSNKERSYDFILAAKNDKYKRGNKIGDGVEMTKKSVQDQFLNALSGVLIVSEKIPSLVSWAQNVPVHLCKHFLRKP